MPGVVAHQRYPLSNHGRVRENLPMLPAPGEEDQGNGQGHRRKAHAAEKGRRPPEEEPQSEREGWPVVRLDQEQKREYGHGQHVATPPVRAEQHVDTEKVEHGDQRGEVRGREVAQDKSVRTEETTRHRSCQRTSPTPGDREHQDDYDHGHADGEETCRQQAGSEEDLGEPEEIEGQRHPVPRHVVLVQTDLPFDGQRAETKVHGFIVVIDQDPREKSRQKQTRDDDEGERGRRKCSTGSHRSLC